MSIRCSTVANRNDIIGTRLTTSKHFGVAAVLGEQADCLLDTLRSVVTELARFHPIPLT